MAQTVAAVVFVLAAWLAVLARWRNRRLESNPAAFLMSASMFGAVGVYSLGRQEFDGLIVIVLVLAGAALVQFLFARYMLRLLADDRPPTA
jgi:intracellular septation protein A